MPALKTKNYLAYLDEIIETGEFVGPDEIAEQALAVIPRDVLDSALLAMLRSAAKVRLQVLRNISDNFPVDIQPSHDNTRKDFSTNGAKPSNGNKPSPKVHNVSKLQVLTSKWQALVTQQLHVPTVGWKTLGTCTYDDLMLVAQQRFESGQAIIDNGKEFEAKAQLLKKYKKSTFDQLPKKVALGEE